MTRHLDLKCVCEGVDMDILYFITSGPLDCSPVFAFPDMLSGGIVEFVLADGDGNQEDHFCLLDVEYCFTTRDIVA
jgi:hypothetical protein